VNIDDFSTEGRIYIMGHLELQRGAEENDCDYVRYSLFRLVNKECKIKKFGPNQHRKLMDIYFLDENNKNRQKKNTNYNQ
jgi:hypothetical protein